MEENLNVDLIINNGYTSKELVDKISKLLENKDTDGINELLNDVSALTLVEAFENFSKNDINDFYTYGDDYSKLGNLFSYLPINNRLAIIKTLPKKQIVLTLRYVKDDDLADFIEDLTKPLREKVLSYLPSKRKKNLITLSKYSDDTIGSIMTTEYLSVKPDVLISDVFKKIKEVGKQMETVRAIFITDNANHLIGIQYLEDMMFVDYSLQISQTMNKDFPYISPIADKENAISVFKEFDLPILPVVSKNKDMLGIITFDDVLDIIESENTEDVYKQSAIAPTNDKSYAENKFYRIALSYVIWLIILLIINTFASMIVDKFEAELLTIPVLISFLPVLNDTGGNSGDQTTSMITRALATGEITTKDYFKVVKKEFIAGLLTAITVALVSFGWTMVELNTPIINVGNSLDGFIKDVGGRQKAFLIISLVISSSLFFAVFVSKLLGATLPIVAKLIHIDPAFISGPLITSIMDILTLLIYFSLAKFIINKFDPGEVAVLFTTITNWRILA